MHLILKPDEDIIAASVATVSLNEFAEVILAGTSVIPISYAFLGPEGIKGSIGLHLWHCQMYLGL